MIHSQTDPLQRKAPLYRKEKFPPFFFRLEIASLPPPLNLGFPSGGLFFFQTSSDPPLSRERPPFWNCPLPLPRRFWTVPSEGISPIPVVPLFTTLPLGHRSCPEKRAPHWNGFLSLLALLTPFFRTPRRITPGFEINKFFPGNCGSLFFLRQSSMRNSFSQKEFPSRGRPPRFPSTREFLFRTFL